ncbi:L-xylulose reductase-like [Mercenaria mercenaria]|uniref:L-xylulose reductase-like n=1 Tax=Mercenaria mercenaria TaxID=6596 RepID=UPI00234ECFCE|nr:L-xylulose reductase-like [Mercenaria mercenaria]XP_053394503.1 L-xylulose reductase-like [Mercenaria mercenaria]
MDYTEFRGKGVHVTGAGKGIGRAIAVRLASLGANVYGISRTQADLDSLRQQAPSIETRLVDISHWDTARKTVEDIGPIDMLINNAGAIKHTPFLDVTKEELDEQHNINFRAAFNITQVVARGMVARGTGGAVVNISSVAGIRTTSNHLCYSTSKAALDMMTLSLAYELGPKKIRVNSVNPTIVMTELGKKGWSDPEKKAAALAKIPVGRFAEEEDVVNATVFLLSEKSSMINGVTLPVDGGMLIDVM